MNHLRAIHVILFVLCGCICLSCSGHKARSYNTATRDMLDYYRENKFPQAYEEADKLTKFSHKKQKQDYYLALLERGKTALAIRDYAQAIRDLQEAERHFLNIEGEFVLTEELTALFTNDLGTNYQVDPHEMLLISPYLVLAYLGQGDFTGARIERNRTINKINYYIEQSEKKHLENPFARYISALIYEQENKIQDARIEYKKLATISRMHEVFEAELQYLDQKSTQCIIFIDLGLVPVKYEKAYGPAIMPIGTGVVTVKFAYPEVRASQLPDLMPIVTLGTEEMYTPTILYDVERMVLSRFEDTNSERMRSLVTRVATKLAVSTGLQIAGRIVEGIGGALLGIGGILFGAVTGFMERADLRQWSTLPKHIRSLRLRNLTPGQFTIQLHCGHATQQHSIELKENELTIAHFTCI